MADAYALADADPVAAVLSWLAQHPKVTEALGGPGRVSGIPEAPWPHLIVEHGPGGSMGELEWLTAPEVLLDVRGDPGGWPGKAELRRITLVCALAAKELPGAAPPPAGPVISGVDPSGLLVWSPLADGQPRWLLGLRVSLHP